MTQKQTQHAQQVVDAFKDKLSKSGIEHVGQKHFEELQLLIESAIDAAVFLEMERVADQVSSLAHSIRNSAEHFDR
ncbi:phosphatase [Ketobacter sp.]|uniref:phosphatase n=1 Tax=Ketobacter sp. TaxID=2083498 RepID=UPI000F164E05|nr:phosphatase [Ketobacter sp.]RLT96896.1 MAG: phosphatase [Ketobacter sp.]